MGNFYSPLGTPEGSLYRFETSPSKYPTARFTREEEENYKCLAAKTLQDAWDLFQKKDWKLEAQKGLDAVFTRTDPNGIKMFKLQAQIDVPPRLLLDELYLKIQELPKWNTTLKESHKVQAIDEYTDITYQISADAAGGLVSSRDFVNLRHWACVEGCYVICSIKTDHPSLPLNKKFVRGENGVCCWVMQSIPGKQDKCNFYWIVNTNLKIWLPGTILAKEMASMMFIYMRDLRKHLQTERRD
ncbi:hypothetical protein NQ318_005307 [Aromia moschata]|uniref:START domain-containing protein n=1 Tax=Aromia moschata TaxID=1265417 RepID=A0AAV8XUE8_9CUCU|nr:hypothetical protein NQ318_005307 [Aromia moschata]